MVDRSDAHITSRLIHQIRLLIATDDEMPTEIKLETQPMLKEFEAGVSVLPAEWDRQRLRAQHAYLYDKLADYPDLEALLSALKNFVPCLA